jgi:ribokinase
LSAITFSERSASPRIAVLGSLNVDYVTYIDRMPVAGETILATESLIEPGGKGANQALVLGRLGADVAMFGAVGHDPNGDLVLERLAEGGVDVSGVSRSAEHTGFATVVVDGAGDNSIIVALGANASVTPDYVAAQLDVLAGYDVIVMQLEIPLETVAFAARELKRRGRTLILDPAPAPLTLPDSVLQHIDIVKPNASELQRLSGTNDLLTGLGALLSRGPRYVVASLGGDGAVVAATGGSIEKIAAEKVPVVDTTGAGDSLTASLAYAIAAGRSVEDAVRFGVGVASCVVQQRGAQAAIPSAVVLNEIWSRTAPDAERDELMKREMA